MSHILKTILSILLLLPVACFAQKWQTPVSITNNYGTGAFIGLFAQLKVVNGNPAMVTYNQDKNMLLYVRATNASGTAWGTLQTIAPIGSGMAGEYCSFSIINGNPAVSYYDLGNSDLQYIRALDVNGNAWGTPVTITATGNTGRFTSLQTVNGMPAIAYYDITNGDLKYVRATNANGTSWGTPVTIDTSGNTGEYTSMTIVGGRPAIAYYDVTNGNLKFVRAGDANGSTWGTPVSADASSDDVGQYTSLVMVNDTPAISYYDVTNQDLNYVRASDATGTTWGTPVAVTATGTVGEYNSMVIIGGYPAISYYNGAANQDLMYIRATDSTGSTWGSSVTAVSTNNTGQYTCMAVVNGNPAIAYYNTTDNNLGYVRATTATGTTWGSPVLFNAGLDLGADLGFEIVNGNPAVSFSDVVNGYLMYSRATDTKGTLWNAPLIVDSAGGFNTSIAIANGNPAITYYDGSDLVFVRATNANGTAWGTPLQIDTAGNTGTDASLLIVNGKPAVSFMNVGNSDLEYIRAADANGSTWDTVVTIDTTGDVGFYTSMAIVNGNPAISYFDASNNDLKYVRASNDTGSLWSAPITVISTDDIGYFTEMTVVKGKPAIAYYNATNGDLNYIRANDSNGTSWPTTAQAVVTNGDAGLYPSIAVVNGNPAVAYQSLLSSSIEYVRATNDTGSAWSTPVIIDTNGCDCLEMLQGNGYAFIAYYNDFYKAPYLARGSFSNWTGAAGTTNWFSTGNWADGAVPIATSEITIPTGASFYPVISSGTAVTGNITIETGASVTVNATGRLDISGNISSSGSFNASAGAIGLAGSTEQVIPANTFTGNAVNELFNTNTAGIALGGQLNINSMYNPSTGGIFSTNGYLTLKSGATGTARIAAGNSGGNYISGDVTVERYIPGGRRVFRFLGHPFTTAQDMSVLTDDIDISGSGGSPFTWTPSGNPSAFYFDPALGDNATTGTNPGWVAYTASSQWAPYQAMRVLVRGSKGEGLIGGTYTPSAVTLDMTGSINQGNVTIPLTKGGSSDFILVGNPFPSQVNMDNVSGTNLASTFTVWDAQQGVLGGYTSYSFGSSSFNLPSYGAFVTMLSASGSVTFEEADKTNGTPASVFKTTATTNSMQLRLEDSTIFWDRFLLRFDDNSVAETDYPDGIKLWNPGISFYTWSKDDSMLSIDTRPYTDGETIPLGLYCLLQKSFKIIVPDFSVEAGMNVFLHDKFSKKLMTLYAGFEYWFTVTADPASTGDNRFELFTKGKPVTSIDEVNDQGAFSLKLVPNPATDHLSVYMNGTGNEQLIIDITDIKGTFIKQVKENAVCGRIRLQLNDMPAGVYIVTATAGNISVKQKLVKL